MKTKPWDVFPAHGLSIATNGDVWLHCFGRHDEHPVKLVEMMEFWDSMSIGLALETRVNLFNYKYE